MCYSLKSLVKSRGLVLVAITATLFSVSPARADVVTEWNDFTITLVSEAIKAPPPANRAVALVQTSVYEAVNAISKQYPSRLSLDTNSNASIEAAVAAATRSILSTLLPKSQTRIDEAYKAAIIQLPDYQSAAKVSQAGEQATKSRTQIDEAYHAAIAKLPDYQSAADGIRIGEQAAKAVMKARAADTVGVPESYRPLTLPGKYVPTVVPVASTWASNRLPWSLTSADQLRPGAPPALDSERWAKDYNEIKELGAHDSQSRTADQTAAAHFWVATSPKVYFPVLQSITRQEGRDVTRNARLLAMASQAIEDALIAVFDAKYAYGFWRPMTAIRNGDQDNNESTERVANWKPLIKTPMHPEYPCAHCIVSGAVGTTIKLDLGDEPSPVLQTASPSDLSNIRSWANADEFMQEVANARVWEGVHYRYSAEVGTRMGQQVAELVVGKFSINQ